MSRNFTNCPLNAISANDENAAPFSQNSTGLCGFSYPATHPFASASQCCDSDFYIANGCFQYCEVSTQVKKDAFSRCVINTVLPENTTDGLAFMTTCNEASEESGGVKGVGLEGMGWKAAVGVGLLLIGAVV